MNNLKLMRGLAPYHGLPRQRITQNISLEFLLFFERGNWHGQVAVKVIEIQQPTAAQLQAFKIQVCCIFYA